MLTQCDGEELILSLTAYHLIGVSPVDGTVYWEEQINRKATGYPLCNMPVVDGNRVFCSLRYGDITWSTYLLQDAGRKLVRTDWSNTAVCPHQESMVQVNSMVFGGGQLTWRHLRDNPEMLVNGKPLSALWDHLREPDEGKPDDRIRFRTPRDRLPEEFHGEKLICQDLKTGRVLGVRFGFRSHGFWGLILSTADRRLYVMSATIPQHLHLVDPSPAMTVHGSMTLPDPDPLRHSGKFPQFAEPFTTPTVYGGMLFVRWHDRVVALDVRSEERAADEDAAALADLPGALQVWRAAKGGDRERAYRDLLGTAFLVRDREAVANAMLSA
jgi:hypothetical protein